MRSTQQVPAFEYETEHRVLATSPTFSQSDGVTAGSLALYLCCLKILAHRVAELVFCPRVFARRLDIPFSRQVWKLAQSLKRWGCTILPFKPINESTTGGRNVKYSCLHPRVGLHIYCPRFCVFFVVVGTPRTFCAVIIFLTFPPIRSISGGVQGSPTIESRRRGTSHLTGKLWYLRHLFF